MTPKEQWSRSLQLLRAGDWEGWPSHEWIRTARWDSKDVFEVTPTFDKPVWNGERGTVLVNADFGMGDTIHFARFLPYVRERAGRTILRCDSDFAGLFDVEVVSSQEPIPECDYIIHMMALPRLLNIRYFSGQPYLKPKQPSPVKLDTLNEVRFTKIGFCWAGSPGNPRDSDRSLDCNLVTKLMYEGDPPHSLRFSVPFFHLVKHLPPPNGLLDFRPYMGDWNATAHLISHLDLVVSVDTAIAHLAGAMGKPTWLLLPLWPDWRWGFDSKTIWYDSMRIFRQTEPTWDKVLGEVAAAIQEL